jgi:hypothetical protein
VKEPKIRIEANQRNLQAQPTMLKNQEKKISLENYVSYLISVKEPQIRMKATQRNLQAQPKILKKPSKHQINQPIRTKKILKKYV